MTNKFVLESPEIENRKHEIDWDKCFICQIVEPKSVALVAPWNKKGNLILYFCISFELVYEFA